MSSTGCLVVSADKVATAIAFQSVMTVGSSAGAAGGVAAAVAVPAASVIRSGTAAQSTSHERAFAGRRRGKWEIDACVHLAPQAEASSESKATTRKRPFSSTDR